MIKNNNELIDNLLFENQNSFNKICNGIFDIITNTNSYLTLINYSDMNCIHLSFKELDLNIKEDSIKNFLSDCDNRYSLSKIGIYFTYDYYDHRYNDDSFYVNELEFFDHVTCNNSFDQNKLQKYLVKQIFENKNMLLDLKGNLNRLKF